MSERIKELARRMDEIEDGYGPLHAIVSHGNVDDDTLDRIERNPPDRPLKPDERDLIAYMRGFTPAERRRAYEMQGG